MILPELFIFSSNLLRNDLCLWLHLLGFKPLLYFWIFLHISNVLVVDNIVVVLYLLIQHIYDVYFGFLFIRHLAYLLLQLEVLHFAL